MEAAIAVIAAILGFGIAFFLLRVTSQSQADGWITQIAEKDSAIKARTEEFNSLQQAHQKLSTDFAVLQEKLKNQEATSQAQLKLLNEAEQKLGNAFAQLSQTALERSSEQFLKLAKENFEKHTVGAESALEKRQLAFEELLKPIKESIEQLDRQTTELEKERHSAYQGITEHLTRLANEANQLSNALRKPHVRGLWGELTLKRVAETSGLVEGQDFRMQQSTDTDDGKLRPDMIVNLPNQGIIVVDSKVPLDSYLEAVSAPDEAAKATLLKAHAAQVRKHITQLSSKSYWSQFETSPEFVVMFVPAESLYQSAIEQDLDLLDTAFRSKVILANPTTLIALLRTIAYGMKQEQIRENALEIRDMGDKLYEALRVYASHMGKVGSNLSRATESYNNAVGSLERNVLSKARQLKSLGVGAGADIEQPDEVTVLSRSIDGPSVQALPGDF